MPEFEAIGDAVTGGAVARAVEPGSGEGNGHTDESRCLNCGCDLTGPYCQCCGQRAHVHRTLGAFWHDLLHGVLHFEGKIWNTLPLLAWKPGELTRRYIDGQRARFVSPVALFLFSVFLMFAVVNLVGGPFRFTTSNDPAAQQEVQRDYEASRADALQEVEQLQARRSELVRQGEPTQEVDRQIAEVRRGMELQKTIFESVGGETTADAPGGEAADQPIADVDVGDVSALSWFDSAYKKAKENPKLLVYKLQANGYKFSWALIPISVPFVWALFLHRRRYRQQFKAYDHTVFVTYSLAFMTLGFIALSLLRPLGLPSSVPFWAMVLVPPVHMYRQLRGTYSLSRLSALWRTVALLFFATITSTIFMALLLLLGVLG